MEAGGRTVLQGNTLREIVAVVEEIQRVEDPRRRHLAHGNREVFHRPPVHVRLPQRHVLGRAVLAKGGVLGTRIWPTRTQLHHDVGRVVDLAVHEEPRAQPLQAHIFLAFIVGAIRAVPEIAVYGNPVRPAGGRGFLAVRGNPRDLGLLDFPGLHFDNFLAERRNLRLEFVELRVTLGNHGYWGDEAQRERAA